jgi:hypothetical protein
LKIPENTSCLLEQAPSRISVLARLLSRIRVVLVVVVATSMPVLALVLHQPLARLLPALLRLHQLLNL